MKRYLIFLLFASCGSHQKITTSFPDETIPKWVRATINIDVEYAMDLQMQELLLLRDSGKVVDPEFTKRRLALLFEAPRDNGTAIFLKHNGKHYLLTARHLLYDPTSLRSPDIFDLIMLAKRPDDVNHPDSIVVFGQGNVLVPGHRPTTELQGYGSSGNTFLLSSPEEDIGLVALDVERNGREFAKALLEKGYVPISSADIDTSEQVEAGDPVGVIGFPTKLSDRGTFTQPRAMETFSSSRISTPIISEGSVVDVRKGKSHLQCNVFTYPGNSGGPLIHNNKLIGIVSQIQGEYITDEESKIEYYKGKWMFAKTIRLMEMLRTLENKTSF